MTALIKNTLLAADAGGIIAGVLAAALIVFTVIFNLRRRRSGGGCSGCSGCGNRASCGPDGGKTAGGDKER